MKIKSMRKKSIAVLAGVAIAGTVGASAASLGGLRSDALGADTGDVSSCDTTGIDVDYDTEFNAAAGEYLVTAINLSDVDKACNGQKFDLTALADDATGNPKVKIKTLTGTLSFLGTAADTAAADGNPVDIPVVAADQFSAESLTGLALTISTAPVAP